MHLHANSMNILARLQAALPTEQTDATQKTAAARRALTASGFELHRLTGGGSMNEQWDGDARRQPRKEPVPARTEVRVEEEVTVEDSISFWA